MKPITDQAYQLLHQGVIALSQVENNGMRIDTEYLNKAIKHSEHQIARITQRMQKDKIYKKWKRNYGPETNIDSREQLGTILFEVLDYPCDHRTETGRPSTNNSVLSEIRLNFVQDFIRLQKIKKANSTYLKGILKEIDQGYLHPFFNLHIPITYRGSSDHPNFQNIPVRDPRFAKLIRKAFISRPHHRIVEVDFSGAEIGGAACYHKDPRMLSYIKNPKKDLHRDMAMQIYMLSLQQINKDIRYCGKNMFVFPQFYGDWYLSCAQSLWEAIDNMSLETDEGVSLKKHLRSKGIKKLGECDPDIDPEEGTFIYHLKEIENDFWNNRFKVYGQWKKDWWGDFCEQGFLDTLTGFRVSGDLSRKEVINYPIQGTAFHWLLWSLIRIQKLLNKYRMRTKIIGQIHDSIVSDVYKKELRNYLEICQQVMTKDVRKHWPWIIVPLSIEAEVAPVGGNWYEKEKYELN
jgi:DNA polymerase-1